MKSSDTACRAIRAASTESDVMRAVSNYLESLEPAALALLPSELTAIGLSHAEEVIHSALELAQSRIGRSAKTTPQARTLSDIVLVLSAAARRLATLANKSPARSLPAKQSAPKTPAKRKGQRRRT